MSKKRHDLFINKAVAKFQEFCKHCTLHGFFYFSEKHYWSIYMTWSCIIASSFALCLFLSHMIWQKYIIDPTFTVVESTHYSTTKIPFPAVTVCDLEKVYGPQTQNITNILRQRSFDEKQIEAFYSSFTAVDRYDYTAPDYVKQMHKVLKELGYTSHALYKTLAKPCEILMVSCAWRTKEHNCSAMFRQVYTYLGYCCQFDMAYFMSNAGSETDFLSGIEVFEALFIVVNGEKVSFDGTKTDGIMQLYVFDDTTSLSVVNPATTITPAGFFDININMWAIDSSTDVQTLSLHNRKCILPSDNLPTGNFYDECMAILILQKVVEFCRCLPFGYTAEKLQVEDYGKCSWEHYNCVFRRIANVKKNIGELITQHECLERCDRVQYGTEIQYIRQRTDIQNFNASHSSVAIHYNANTCFKYRREVLYAWDQMLANLGGIFGLCLGGSLISIIELIWFSVDLVLSLYGRKGQSKTKPARNSRIFTLTKDDFMKSKEKMVRHKFVN